MDNFLPHTRNSKAGSQAWEPVVGAYFAVYLMPPTGVSDATILTEHVKSIGGLFINPSEDAIEQQFQQAKRSYAGANANTTYDIEIVFSMNLNDANDNYVHRIIMEWSRKKWDERTGRRGLKKDYMGQIVGVKYNRDGSIYQQRTACQAWPKGDIPDLNGDYSAADPQDLTITFRADWVEDL